MTYATDKDRALFTLSPEETKQFDLGTPIVKRVAYRSGIVDIEIQKRIICPDAETRATLRKLNEDKPNLTIGQMFDHVMATPASHGKGETIHKQHVLNDLRRFIENVGGDVPVAAVMGG